MNVKKIFLGGIYALSFTALLLSGGILRPSEAKALTADELHDMTENWEARPISEPKSGKEDPHAKFRDGSMGDMMHGMTGGMSPHGASKKKSPHSGKGMHSPFSAQGMKEKLGLDDGQTKKMKTVISTYRKASIRANAELKIAQIEFDESVADKGFNLRDVESKAKNREAFATTLTMVRVKALADARDVLSEEQFGKFMTMITHRMSRHKGKGKHSMMKGRHGSKSAHGGSMPHGKSKSAKGHHGSGTPHGMMGESYDD